MTHTKPKILVTVLTGTERTNWINPDLLMNMLQMSKDPRFDVSFFPVRDARPFEVARNVAIHAARHIKADWLLSFDNDAFVHSSPLDIIAAAGPAQDVIGLTYGIAACYGAGALEGKSAQFRLFPDTATLGTADGPFRETAAVGGGVLMVRNTVWQKIPRGPWFVWGRGQGELSEMGLGEDVHFCNLVRQHGLRIWTHSQPAGHYHTVDMTGLVCTLAKLTNSTR
jgi:hypothetical protein